jgi:hypothetical protein
MSSRLWSNSIKSYKIHVSIRYRLINFDARFVTLRITRLVLLTMLIFSGVAQLLAQDESWIDKYFARVARNQAEQPHWITPVATVTPRLEQEIRYDIFWQQQAKGYYAENYGGSKGLELIPADKIEVIVNIPPYLVHNNPKQINGWGDESLLLKYRVLSKNEESGNYILTAFVGLSIPTGSHKNGSLHAALTPTLAGGKGWGKFDFQTTAGITLPTGESKIIGQPVVWNLTGQYHVLKQIWPEVEMNYTYFHQGSNDGHTQVFMTPGVVFGRFPIWKRVAFVIGGGVQIAVTHFHTYNHGWILTTRMPF